MRVGIVALLHESNTFADGKTPLARFEEDLLVEGEPLRQRLQGTHHEVGGFFEQLAADGIEAVPVFGARAMPSGTIAADVAEHLLHRLLAAVRAVGPLDGWLVAPHGAGVSERWLDFDGTWLTELRRQIGPDVPMLGTLDLHANLSPQMVAATNALVAYRTNPHLDQRERGREAAALLARTLRGAIRPTIGAAFPPLVTNIEAQSTSESPCRELIAVADAVRSRPGVLSVSLLLGFPYADVPEMGSSAVVVTDGQPTLAQDYADEIGDWWWEHRDEFAGNLVAIPEAVRQARETPGTVGLLDMGDNIGGGSPGDSTLLLQEVIRQGAAPAFACLYAPEAVAQARQAGVGGSLSLSVGTPTITGQFTVVGLYDGRFEEMEARHGGQRQFDQGATARVEAPGLTLLLTSRRIAPFSLRQLTAFEVEPARFRAIVIKGVHAPRAAYAPVCSRLIRVNTPGITSADLGHFAFARSRRLASIR